MSEIEKVISRIRKLMAMAEDTSSPNEASIAVGRARALMDAHQISEGMLDDAGSDEFGTVEAGGVHVLLHQWKGRLAVSVAKYNDCLAKVHRVVDGGKVARRVAFDGMAQDARVAGMMYEYLVGTIERLCREWVSTLGYKKYPSGLADTYKKSCTSVVQARLQELQAAREEVITSSGTSLVLSKMNQVVAKFGEPNYCVVKNRYKLDSESSKAYYAGAEAGKSINLSDQIEAEQAAGALK